MYNDEWLREHRPLEPERMTAGDMIARKEGDSPALVWVAPGASTREALGLITRHDISQLPVCDGDRCVGSLSESSVMARVIEKPALLDEPIDPLMDGPFPVVAAEVAMGGVGRMLSRQAPAVLARGDAGLIGIITRYDMVRHLTT